MWHFSKFAYALALPLIAVFAGCSTLSTETIDLTDAYGNVAAGGPYNPGSGYYLLSMTLLSIEVRKNKTDGKLFITDPTASNVADARYPYHIRTHMNAFSDDHYEIETNGDGTLAKIKTTSTDKTGEVIKTVGSFVVTLLTGVPSTVAAVPRAALDEVASSELKLSFDPSDPTDVARVNDVLTRRDYPFLIKACSLGWEPSSTNSARPVACNSAPQVRRSTASRDLTVPQDGVIYRPALPWRVTVTGGSADVIQSQHVVSIPNRSPLLSIPLDRTAFVNRVNEITFENGIPTKVDMNKPSEALAIVSIPLDILNGVLKSISQIIPLASASATAENALLMQQKLIYENRLALEKTKAEYEASRSRDTPEESSQVQSTDKTVGGGTNAPRVGE